jgi:hypothetical protein
MDEVFDLVVLNLHQVDECHQDLRLDALSPVQSLLAQQ